MHKKNILLADSNRDIKGGGQISLLELTRVLDRKTFDLFALTDGEGELSARLEKNKVLVHPLRFPRAKSINIFASLRCIGQIRRIIRHHKIDILHSNDTRAHLFCGIAARISGIPCVFHYRVSYTDGLWDRLLPLLASRVIAASRAIGKRFPTLSEKKLATIYNAVDETRFCKTESDLRRHLGIPESAFVIGTIGRLSTEKGIETFLHVCQDLSGTIPGLHAIVVGKGDKEHQQRFSELTRALSLAGKIHFMDHVEDVPGFYSAIDSYCLFSVNEGFNRSILEAMASECSVVATEVGGNVEALEDEITGYLVPPKDRSLAVERLSRLAQSKILRTEIGARARARVLEYFTLTAQGEQVGKLYEKCCA